jgi:hypothetical protein
MKKEKGKGKSGLGRILPDQLTLCSPTVDRRAQRQPPNVRPFSSHCRVGPACHTIYRGVLLGLVRVWGLEAVADLWTQLHRSSSYLTVTPGFNG